MNTEGQKDGYKDGENKAEAHKDRGHKVQSTNDTKTRDVQQS